MLARLIGRRSSLLLLALGVQALQVCCIGDAFTPTRTLPGRYHLYRFEEDRYYVEDDSGKGPPGGVLQGSVEKIGWNESYILAWCEGMLGRSGWMIIDVSARAISGPMSDGELATRQAGDPILRSIEVYPVAVAWDKLEAS